LNNKYLKLVEFVPIAAFGVAMRLTSENGPNWKLAFIVGACLALLEKALLLSKRIFFDRLLLGADAFLIIGGAGFLFNIHFVLHIYGSLLHASLFASLLAVGVLTTFFTRGGFVGVKHQDRHCVVIYSFYLLGAGAAAFLISFAFRGNDLLAGAMPLTGVAIVSRILVKRLRETAVEG
jgi:hypothetical protein